jgi:energy-coupling factor transporter ATP-binding protein EcfA2
MDGLPVTPPNLREIRRRVGVVFQDSDNQLFMPTVPEDVAFGPLAVANPRPKLQKVRARRNHVSVRLAGEAAPD